MTEPLFPDRQPCGCPRGEGHRCPPTFGTLEQMRQKYVPLERWSEATCRAVICDGDRVKLHWLATEESAGLRPAPSPPASHPPVLIPGSGR